MAYMINDNCINCNACSEDCPTDAIRVGNYYEFSKINSDLCTECVGFYESPACLEVCPACAIILNPTIVESKIQLLKKAEYIKSRRTINLNKNIKI
jgi:ferredoxin